MRQIGASGRCALVMLTLTQGVQQCPRHAGGLGVTLAGRPAGGHVELALLVPVRRSWGVLGGVSSHPVVPAHPVAAMSPPPPGLVAP